MPIRVARPRRVRHEDGAPRSTLGATLSYTQRRYSRLVIRRMHTERATEFPPQLRVASRMRFVRPTARAFAGTPILTAWRTRDLRGQILRGRRRHLDCGAGECRRGIRGSHRRQYLPSSFEMTIRVRSGGCDCSRHTPASTPRTTCPCSISASETSCVFGSLSLRFGPTEDRTSLDMATIVSPVSSGYESGASP